MYVGVPRAYRLCAHVGVPRSRARVGVPRSCRSRALALLQVPTLLFDCLLDTFFLLDIIYSFCVGVVFQGQVRYGDRYDRYDSCVAAARSLIVARSVTVTVTISDRA